MAGVTGKNNHRRGNMPDSKETEVPVETEKVETVEEVKPEVTEETVKEKVEPVEAETKKTEPPVNEEVEALKALVTQLTEKVTELTDNKDEPVETVKDTEPEGVEQPDEKVVAYEAALDKVVTEKLSTIPEGIASLMPDGLTAVEKLDWVEKAQKAVPVKEETVEQPKQVIESIGKATPVQSAVEVDVTTLSPFQKIQMAFKDPFNTKS